MTGPIENHPLRDDPVSAGARSHLTVGGRELLAVSDGFFRMPREFLGSAGQPTAGHDALAAQYGDVRMPLGCFIWPDDQLVLIDTGAGPADHGGRGMLVGGRLLDGLRDEGFSAADVEIVCLSHLHLDHIGWVADANGDPVFANARVLIGEADWNHFIVAGADPAPDERVVHALLSLAARGQVELVDGERTIVPGLTRMPAPGHTPGHSIFMAHDRGDRVLLFGDAMYCPHQLSHDEWAAMSDVDPVLAARTRARYVRDLEESGGSALGCHFPELAAGRAWSRSR